MAVVTHAEGGRPVIEDCNDLFAETLGYEKTDVIGDDLDSLYTVESQRKLLRKGGYDRALNGAFVREHRELVTADGETVEALLRAVPRQDAHDDMFGTLAFYVDISERRRAERQRDRLEEFRSVVSHDLRSPLTVADGHVEMAQKNCESDHLARAADAIDRSQALVDDLLTLARGGDRVTDLRPTVLADVAERGWQTVETGPAVVEIDTSQVARADSSQLRELFETLYRNAVEHGSASPRSRTRENGVEHSATDSRREADTVERGDDVTVSVGAMDDGFYLADTGPGVPESDRGRIFEAGYSTAEKGTGLGLRIVEQIADAHGWEITVTESE